MRLTPVEHPANPLMRLAYRLSTRRYGKVLIPLRVMYARKPRLLYLAGQIQRVAEGLSLEPSLRMLVQVYAARINGCAFCQDLILSEALRRKLGRERFDALADYRTSPLFSDRERAALALVEDATGARHVSDATWAALRAHFSETEIVELVWANAAENYFNLQATVLGFESEGLAARV
ncbi:MAG TPA: carboxymuconolactone decarboxylase family protein [Longimicrobium sp.]|nr:carboxymuconolactone decarboxylase family protein [Longimicrobium sp.]